MKKLNIGLPEKIIITFVIIMLLFSGVYFFYNKKSNNNTSDGKITEVEIEKEDKDLRKIVEKEYEETVLNERDTLLKNLKNLEKTGLSSNLMNEVFNYTLKSNSEKENKEILDTIEKHVFVKLNAIEKETSIKNHKDFLTKVNELKANLKSQSAILDKLSILMQMNNLAGSYDNLKEEFNITLSGSVDGKLYANNTIKLDTLKKDSLVGLYKTIVESEGFESKIPYSNVSNIETFDYNEGLKPEKEAYFNSNLNVFSNMEYVLINDKKVLYSDYLFFEFFKETLENNNIRYKFGLISYGNSDYYNIHFNLNKQEKNALIKKYLLDNIDNIDFITNILNDVSFENDPEYSYLFYQNLERVLMLNQEFDMDNVVLLNLLKK